MRGLLFLVSISGGGTAFADADDRLATSAAAPTNVSDTVLAPTAVSVSIIAHDAIAAPDEAVTGPLAAVQKPSPQQSAAIKNFGAALDTEHLEDQRGGAEVAPALPASSIFTNGAVTDNRAVDVITGSNSIRDGAFANASGLPIVIQNTGANVLIQNATIVNVQLR